MLSHPLISFPPGRGGGRARGAAWRVRVCDCNEGPLAEDHWVCTINNEGALKKKKKKNINGRRARRAAWWPRCAARRWRAVDRGADSAAAPSHAAGRVASSAPKQTRARGAAAAAKTTNVYFSFSSRLVSSCRRRTRARRAPVSPRSLREGRFEPGASRCGGGARRQKVWRSLH